MPKYYKNQYLFSEIYLEEITNLAEDRSLISTLETISETALYADRNKINVWNETFVHELLRTLKFKVDPIDENLALLKQFGEDDTPLTLCYSLLPNKNLDNSSMGSNYAYQIISALKKYNLKWGILTNGNQWRIYHIDEPTPYENYLEIDLESILSHQDKHAFQLIFFFLKAENFEKDKEGNSKFDFFKKESQDKIAYIEDELKNALKQKEEGGQDILSNICYGYVQYLANEGTDDFSDENLRDEIYGGALLYMFRLLFLFYARARDLMAEEDSDLFDELVNKAKQYQTNGNANPSSKELWVQLRVLFGEIDRVYNGGLFNRDENNYTRFIENTTISDTLLSGVIYNMSHYEEKDGTIKPISYRDMNVRHLGTLYEGLLEHKLFVAEEDIEVKVTKKEIQFIPESDGGKIKEGQYIAKGQVYFGNDKGLRKATGSYYTPEYIVEYIVTNTVDEKLNELKEKFDKQIEPLIQDLEVAINDKEKQQITLLIKTQLVEFVENEMLSLSVLDPAMGSGHFLVNATSHIANFITSFLNGYAIESEIETNTKYWSRKVVENCIYGVDLNILATELAKLSLWILTMAKDKPLSFLNHHLKIGNSLIGVKLSRLGKHPLSKKGKAQKDLFTQDPDFKSIVQQVINDYSQIRNENSDSKSNIETKKEYLDEIDNLLKPYKDLCNLNTSIHFGNDISEEDYDSIISNKLQPRIDYYEKYFHWELEFPEIFLVKKGFDCVIGNPPYGELFKRQRNYFTKTFISAKGKHEIFKYFIEKGLHLIKNNNALLSFIVPNTWVLLNNFEKLREIIIAKYSIVRLTETLTNVFSSANVDTNIFTISSFNVNIPGLTIVKKDLLTEEIITLDPNSSNFSLIFKNSDPIINLINQTKSVLNDYCEVWQGLIAYGSKDQPRIYSSNYKETQFHRKLLFGRDIEKYIVNWHGEYLQYGDWLHRPRPSYIFENQKLLVQRIRNPKLKDRLIVAYDGEKYINGTGMSNILLREGQNLNLLYLLGLLNSKLINYWFNYYYTDVNIKPEQLRKIPIKVDSERFDRLVSAVTNIIELRKNKITAKKQEIELDYLVYKIYNISFEHIKIIEKNGMNLTENEYSRI
uniref:Eco57I restriction-modification methylase domain-containing protein n=1 Tax=uncultured Draconibacterium sp. TaxID=1573823 RepID=UPI0032164552